MLTEIKLENFRGFDQHTIPLRPLTIIVGKNNAGKSTVVEALRLISIVVSRYKNIDYQKLPNWLDRPLREKAIYPSTKELELNDDSVFFRLGDPPAKITAKFSTGELVEIYISKDLEVLGVITDATGNVVQTKGQANKVSLPPVSILPQIGPLLRDEFLRDETYVRQSMTTSRSSLHFRNQLHFMREFFPSFKDLAEETWNGLAVDPVEFKRKTLTEKQVYLFVRDADFTAEVGWMGHGLQMWLQAMWFITYAGSSSSIILDEPDVYMHADLQRRLIRLLKGRQKQTIIATHSIEIMSEVEPEDIMIIERRSRRSHFAESHPEIQSLLTGIGSIQNIQLARLNAFGRFILIEGDDMDFFKRLQNVINPNSVIPIDIVPHKAIGGWSGWEKAKGFAMLLNDAAKNTIVPYCIFDSDYHTEESIRKRHKQAKTLGIELHIWKRKEIENYLLIPAAIHRLIMNEMQSKGEPPTEQNVSAKLIEIAEEQHNEVLTGYASEYFDEDRSIGFPGANKMAAARLKTRWATDESKLETVCGSAVISGIAEWANKVFKANINALKIAKELRPSEVHAEVVEVIHAIENRVSFPTPSP